MDISFKNVSHTYQPNSPFEYTALNDLSFSIDRGSYVAIVGHTGSGKSTLIQHLNGLLKPTSGQVKMGDFTLAPDEKTSNIKMLRKQVGIVFQYPEHQLFEETIEKDIAFGPKNFGATDDEIQERIPKVMQAVQLSEDLLDRSPFDLSGGQMRRVAIAGVLAMNPRVLVLDEPTAGLDPKGQKEMMDMFYSLHESEDLTTILVTHSMEDALEYADHVIILENGKKFMEGNPEDIFVQKEKLQQVQLDIPEKIAFLKAFEERFSRDMPYVHSDMKQLAKTIQSVVKGDEIDG
ncbi:energy-coupling factor transport system ATP-binding protein [Pelagirhabdus alkalitolerans]|uniref:Energy-coupling factor transporter ATP-binding protein EcfA2 n=1 Tax=Pelagirhabdus alkalitolerans TaxID=1612202 RepID=A0A1G6M6R1_9BACI|nr:energy-coupling factor ABC transporter ATP-binding protein [Pelagirhabdus alkalitolerans]SDC50666.1 energy-coupling factor transport system ATP-binding protein [Pelagirhabdus alkalitolerans]